MRSRSIVALLLTCVSIRAAGRQVLVISVDGLDYRYLRDADKLGLRLPNMRRLTSEGQSAAGVVGVVPTVTWPSHTTLISGVPPHTHGILGNRRSKTDGGDYYWSTSLLKSRTLLNVLREKGMKSAAITWPVTVDAPVDYNLPEYFQQRNGGSMDLPSIESKATPGLVQEIAARFPSFLQFWMNDRTRALAAIYLLERKKPDLLLLHLVDHDAEAHDHGPFSREAKAVLEYTDDLIGDILRAAPPDTVVALVSDHGFERTDNVVNLHSLAGDGITVTPFLLIGRNADAAARVRRVSGDPRLKIGREIPIQEFRALAPQLGDAVAVWEPVEHYAFAAGTALEPLLSSPHEKDNHGLWPTRHDYHSVFTLWGRGFPVKRLPEIHMTEIAGKLAETLGVSLTK